MGKYMRKSKVAAAAAAGDQVAVMELVPQSSSPLGVRTRTRTKTLALQTAAAAAAAAGTSYLQLRSRRLEKPPIPFVRTTTTNNNNPKKQQPLPPPPKHETPLSNPNPNPNLGNSRTTSTRLAAVNSPSVTTQSSSRKQQQQQQKKKEEFLAKATSIAEFPEAANTNTNCVVVVDGVGIEPSFGENVLETDQGRERSTRESTPCSLIRELNNTESPVSSTRPTSFTATNRRRIENTTMRRNIPTSNEMDELFAGAEEEQQRVFTEKYNFDPVNDTPLPGRYEWVRIDP